jgi:hypothetical protein
VALGLLCACGGPSPALDASADDAHVTPDGGARDAGAHDAAHDATADAAVPDAASDSGTDGGCATDTDGDGDPALECGGGDCDDADPTRSSLAAEVCSADPTDEDCDGSIDEALEGALYTDDDGDGYGSTEPAGTGCPHEGARADSTDCDDANADVSPGATEACGNAIDDDCDGTVDETAAHTYFHDGDGDGFGVDADTITSEACSPPSGYAAVAGDCDDSRGSVFPGNPNERCDGVDEDCSLGVDGGGVDAAEDVDGDRHSALTAACTGGFPKDDCDDTNAAVHPGASEICDRLDDDCASGGGAAPEEDKDDDGYAPLYAWMCTGGPLPDTDCDDTNAARHPGAAEICNRVDDDCSADGLEVFEDYDHDMHAPADATCTGGFSRDDCDDHVATTHPGADELCNAVDDDCSLGGGADPREDADHDYHAPIGASCSGGYPIDDCDDTNAAFHPGAPTLAPRVLAPANGTRTSRSETRPTFRWESGGDACLGAPTWEISIDDSCPSPETCAIYMMSPEVHDTGITTTTYTSSSALPYGSGPPFGRRYWYHVRECNGASCGPYSPIRYLDIARPYGDLNGDGDSDVVVGAPTAAVGFGAPGRVHLYYGGASGPPSLPSASLDSPETTRAMERFGAGVVTLDITGDGYDDLAASVAGYIYYWPGSASGISTDPTAGTWSAAIGTGPAVLAAGDVTGDSYDDVVGGWPASNAARLYQGDWYGLDTGDDIDPPEGTDADARFGAAVAVVGDVSSNGYAEVVVGAPAQDGSAADVGRAYLYFGRSSSVDSSPLVIDPPASVIAGASFGAAVAGGDVDGVGDVDVVIGAPHDGNGASSDAGRVFVFLGDGRTIDTTPSAVLTAPASESGAHLGASIAVGDVSGDGIADIVAGAPEKDGASTDEGAVYVWLGSAGGPSSAVLWTSPASAASGAFGASVAIGGDVDHDGYADVRAGAPGQSVAYLFLGDASGPDSIASFAFAQPGTFGAAVARHDPLGGLPSAPGIGALRSVPLPWRRERLTPV